MVAGIKIIWQQIKRSANEYILRKIIEVTYVVRRLIPTFLEGHPLTFVVRALSPHQNARTVRFDKSATDTHQHIHFIHIGTKNPDIYLK